MTKITHLNIYYNNKISQSNIDDLDLVKLYAGCNTVITRLDHLKNLRVLGVSGDSNIDQVAISNLNLKKLYAVSNLGITNVTHMTNLKLTTRPTYRKIRIN